MPRVSAQGSSIQPDFKTSNVVMTSEMLTKQDQVSIGRGATLAQRCAICHGPQGVSDANSPNLAGQFAAVTYKELNDFKTGARVNVVMSPFAANMSNQDMLDVAAYYAYLPRVPSNNLDAKLRAAADRGHRRADAQYRAVRLPAMATSTTRPAAPGSAASRPSISRRSCRRSPRAPAATTSASRCATSPAR